MACWSRSPLPPRFPERVRKLALIARYAEGFGVRNDPQDITRRETLLNLGRGYAPSDRVSFARMLGALYWPEANNEMMDWFVDRLGTISVLSDQLQSVFRDIDLRPELAKIKAPHAHHARQGRPGHSGRLLGDAGVRNFAGRSDFLTARTTSRST